VGEALNDLKAAIGERYTIERELGRGGMAVVYLAHDVKHGRSVALKVLRPELTASLGAERFVQEIQIASKLSHPHIVPLYDSGEAEGFLYFVMPYLEGESLRDRLDRERRLSFDEALPIVQQVAIALSYAHERGVIHRDIKPENILFAGDEAVVADFGIARAISAAGGGDLTTSGLPLGTLGYMSPEQAAGSRTLDGRTDVYSLACVLYEMLVGRPPGRWLKPEALQTGRMTGASPEERLQLDSLPPPVERALVKALAQDHEDRYAEPEAFVTALTAAPGLRVRIRRRRKWIAIAIVGMFAAATIVTLGLSLRSGSDVDPDVVAVAPFEAFSEDLEQWREGLVDILSAKLDGAGPLTSVSPSATIRQWSGRAEPAAAQNLGQEVGAGLIVYGTLVSSGTDSVRVQATLYDAAVDRIVSEFDVRDAGDRVDRLADSLAVRLMRELSRRRSLGVWRLASLGSSSPAAVKAFLQGEQHYRRFALDSARFYYEQALELDSTFALAHSRRAIAMGWSLHNDPEFVPSLLRAGELNHGLARRESLLLTADSIEGALSTFSGDSSSWALLDRLFSTLEYAAQEYPLDPQVWYELGEARYHTGPFTGETNASVQEAFANAVRLDSSFVPAYRHLAELALLRGDPVEAMRVIDADLARADSTDITDALAVVRDLLDADRANGPSVEERMQGLSEEAFYQAWYDVKGWPDVEETAVRIARTWAESGVDGGAVALAWSLAFRGHIREAYETAGPRSINGVLLARLGFVQHDTATAVYEEWLETSSGVGIHLALPWWAEEQDTTSLQRALARWDSLSVEADPETAARAAYLAEVGTAYLTLARGDTVETIRQFENLRVYPCLFCYQDQLTRARLLLVSGRDREAARLFDTMPFMMDQAPPIDAVVVALERGRVHERLGNRAAAIDAFTFVTEAWRNADPELQPMVDEARAALARLVAEPHS
jgi:serine/threonine-protein kinase